MAKEAKGKAAEVKAEVAAAASKAETVKAAEPKKEEVKKAEPKKEEVKKAEPKKEEPKKEEVKKTAGRPKKQVKDKVPMTPDLFVQYDDDPAGAQEANVGDIVAKIKAAYVAEGHRESSIKSLQVYLKPQEWKAYYVINGKLQGEIPLF